ncbi:hypothetical protein DKM44_02965 [Deinococcus irradiatisoli]|uniref:O-antigen ligase-related domain-containing protein n=1 Tax=Deinococcus irradiatisoli TaxID=2202254 RepID=A0A2Z3JBG5_9DEIO|nr:O-antigen ligase family protein [Deinococcus irradiatisoli]AWN22325.1 hypothetical protein DKM44_02965 [Deinococcus irradiatisoli]
MQKALIRSAAQAQTSRASMLLILTLCLLPLIVNLAVSLSYDDVFLIPKVWWLLGAVLPSALYMLWIYCAGVPRWLWLMTGVWLLWCLLGFVLGVRPDLTFTGLPGRMVSFPVYFSYAAIMLGVFGWISLNPQAQHQLPKLVWMVLPLGLYAAGQYYGLLGIPGGLKEIGVAALDVGTTMGHRGYFAGLLAVVLPLALNYTKQSRWGYLLVFMIAFSFAASLSRGPILGGLAAYLYWVVLGRNWRAWGVHLTLVLGVLSSLPTLTAHQMNLRALGGSGQDITDNSDRTVLWNTALKGIRERPLLGWGQGQLVNIMATRPDATLLKEKKIDTTYQTLTRMPRLPDQALSWRVSKAGRRDELITHFINTIHNEYLEYALNFGIPASLAFAALLALGIWRGRFLPWAGASVLGYAIYLLTWPETLRFAPIAWAILGAALAAAPPRPAALPVEEVGSTSST